MKRSLNRVFALFLALAMFFNLAAAASAAPSDEVTLQFASSSLQPAYNNAVFVNGIFSQYITVTEGRLNIEKSVLKDGENTVSFICGNNKTGTYYDRTAAPNTRNHNDPKVKDIALTVDDTVYIPTGIVKHFPIDQTTPVATEERTEQSTYEEGTLYTFGDGQPKSDPEGSNGNQIVDLSIPYMIDFTFQIELNEKPGGEDSEDYHWNVEEGKAYRGECRAAVQAPNLENLSLTVDGTRIESVNAAGDAQFTMESNGIQSVSSNFKNAIIANEGSPVYLSSDSGISEIISGSELKFGELNSIFIYCGNSNGYYDETTAPKNVNHDDFEVWNFGLTLANGSVVKPVKVKEYRITDREIPAKDNNNVIETAFESSKQFRIGDGFPAGSDLARDYKIELIFVLTDYSNEIKYFPINTAEYGDGSHIVKLLDKEEEKRSAEVLFDNTSPEIELSFTDGAELLQGTQINAGITDAVSGIAEIETLIDGKGVTLPYNTEGLSLGEHTFSVKAKDTVGNSAMKSGSFNLVTNTISITNPGTVKIEEGHKLSVTPSISGGGDITVDFYEGTVLKNIIMKGNAAGDMSLSEKSYAGETSLRKANGYYETSAENNMPYQVFDVMVDDLSDPVRLTYTGHTREGERLALSVWNENNSAWDKVDSDISRGNDFILTADVEPKTYAVDNVIKARVAPEVAENGSNTILWVTDTQYYTANYASDDTYNKIMEWAKEQYAANKISYITHTGDIIESVGNESQWLIADAAHDVVDNAGIPNGVTSGNHDVGTAGNLRYELYHKYFGEERYNDNFWYGGSLEDNKHSYTLFTVGDKDFIALYLGMGEENKPETIAWANRILQKYNHRNAIVNLHQYNNPNAEYTTDRAPEVFEKIIVPNDNVVLVLCGHDPGASRKVKEIPGTDRTVIELMSDYQFVNRGGDGFIRLLTFENGKLINKTYSPTLNQYNAFADDIDDFTLDISLKNAERTISTKSFTAGSITENKLGTATAASGSTALIKTSAEIAGWYVKASLGEKTVTSEVFGFTANPALQPKQVIAHVGENFTTGMNFTWTTAEDAATKVILRAENSDKDITVNGSSSLGAGSKYFHNVTVNGLTPDTAYTYCVGDGSNMVSGTFRTAPSSESKDSFKFVYLADTQISNSANAKAAGAVFREVMGITDSAFTFIAGDVTDNGNSEEQYELLFQNGGLVGNAGEELFLSKALAVVRGNHDNDAFNGHINAPDIADENTYSFDYGPAKFIMLNLEHKSAEERTAQEIFLREEVKKAKASEQWTIVAFHKSIYTGASHIVDSDVIDARKYWSPIFAELDIDFVMQGHDHVYARGFVNGSGENASPETTGEKVNRPQNAPLYMVGGHSGGLKWYNQVPYTVSEGDPLTPNYTFLDRNSTDDGSAAKKEQNYIEVTVSNTELRADVYMFKYDTDLDTVTTEKYLYDTITVKRNVSASSNIQVENIKWHKGEKIRVPVTASAIESLGRLYAEFSYDDNLLSYAGVESAAFDSLAANGDTNGLIKMDAISAKGIKASEKTVVAYLLFNLKEEPKEGAFTTVSISNMEAKDAAVTGTPATIPVYGVSGTLEFINRSLGDVNDDNKVNGVDALMLLQHIVKLRELSEEDLSVSDMNNDGAWDTADVLAILNTSVQ